MNTARDADDACAIRARGLSKRFGRLQAVNHVDLDVPARHVYGFIVPNGSRKSTTIRMLCGLLTPSEGDIEVLGLEIPRQADALRSNFTGRAKLVAIDDSLAPFETLDWQALEAVDPQQAQALWAQYQGLTEARGELAAGLEQQGRQEALEAQRDHATRVQDGLEVLARDIEGWSPERAGKLLHFVHAELGLSH